MATQPLVSILMGSQSDWEIMARADGILEEFGVPHECRVLSAHRTPDALAEYIRDADARGVQVFIAGAGGAAALPGAIAAYTVRPVLGVPVRSWALSGEDSLLSMVQMPSGVPVGTLAIGKPGATNAALLAIAMLANNDPELRAKLEAYRENRARQVLDAPPPGSA